MKLLATLLCLCSVFVTFAQQPLTGIVISKNTGEPISGVAIYLSGTSKGVISGVDGTFEINYPEDLNVPLVFRMMGFETLQFPEPLTADLSIIKMVEKPDELDTIYIADDNWSREKKERYFITYFLGRVPAARDMEILNLDKVRLRFNQITHTLTADSNEPILVRNEVLGYDIQVDISEFEVLFEPIELGSKRLITDHPGIKNITHRPVSTYMAVSTYFTEMTSKRPSQRRRTRNRERLYNVTDLRLYRSMAQNTLEEKGYTLMFNREKVAIENHIRTRSIEGIFKVSFREREYIILDKQNNQTDLHISEARTILIDNYGNCLTGRNITFGGFLGKLHLSGMLPLDYFPE
jgi:hypothetical protein